MKAYNAILILLGIKRYCETPESLAVLASPGFAQILGKFFKAFRYTWKKKNSKKQFLSKTEKNTYESGGNVGEKPTERRRHMADTQNKNYQKADVIARLFGKTTRRIQQLTQDGILPTEETPSGRRYDLLPTITRYIKYLEERAEQKKPRNMAELEEEKLAVEIKYKRAKADKAKLELSELKGMMHRASDIEKLTNELVFAVRSMLLALPGRVAMDLAAINTAPEVSQYMARHVAVLLDELTTHEYNPDSYKQLVREREGWQTEHDDGTDLDDETEV